MVKNRVELVNYEESLRKVYEGTFEILREMQDPERTSDASRLISLLFSTRITPVAGDSFPNSGEYSFIAKKIDTEYHNKFEQLGARQRGREE